MFRIKFRKRSVNGLFIQAYCVESSNITLKKRILYFKILITWNVNGTFVLQFVPFVLAMLLRWTGTHLRMEMI